MGVARHGGLALRQFTAPKGDYAALPLSPAGRKIADSWDPARDEAAGEQCKAYGAAGLMRLPTRLRVSWQDDTTLRLETDAGTQTRRSTSDRRGATAATGKGSRRRRGTTRGPRSPVAAAARRPADRSRSSPRR